ncbi:LytR/AlgR family response regulator transcription factor [Ohtaekwangia koreensis]|uniref:Two component transcriptional regulator, LytTR family n=1 Tax=Ohtaekwangia koreensis TaxID=688867 RepID=A0A1T5M0J0_9BACT|nr:LytTR family DNA-binding domain-containing protein [Ohtaekwangia koreensis]SKC81564.1 two component transcriptional regulator, LytTR family [Ohtaekwangia koreensis]
MKINCIVIDDEPLALELVESYIKKIPYLHLKGLFHEPFSAIEMLRSDKVDLIFLDVNMPDISGIEFLKSFDKPPAFIFITAYDQFAVQGFELNALDYLLKPVPFNRFLKASDRAFEMLKPKEPALDGFIFVKSEHNTIKVSLSSIYFIEGYKDYLKIYTDEANPILTLTTLKAFEELLPTSFQRVHRSYIISVSKIISFRSAKVYIRNRYIPIGESYTEQFQRLVVEGRLR